MSTGKSKQEIEGSQRRTTRSLVKQVTKISNRSISTNLIYFGSSKAQEVKIDNSKPQKSQISITKNPELSEHSEHNGQSAPVDIELLEKQLESSENSVYYDKPSDAALQLALARKRELKGSYKAKLSLEKLIVEHERKKLHLRFIREKLYKVESQLQDLGSDFIQRDSDGQLKFFPHKSEAALPQSSTTQSRTHLEFLFKEMIWMKEDFEREHKKKTFDAKKNSRMCRKELSERQIRNEKLLKDQQVEVRRKAINISRMVQNFWKSVDKIVRHNYGILFDRKKQQVRAKKLEKFVSKHLKLSVKVAEELNTKSFVEQSMYRDAEGNLVAHQEALRKQVKIIDSETGFDAGKQQMSDLADMTVKMAEAFQPVGNDLTTANVKTKVPFLLHGTLREYQIIGLDWLVTLHNKRLNGILADEMGLGKTIQTISLLASLACDRGIWGPHLIIVPTTIMINWEMEFKRWCPSLKVLTYFGSQKERKLKRQGWSKENSFHVCITSYKLVIQDHFVFRRKKWYYMVLDEAQNIKNFKSQRWQTLLRFNTRRRLLLTGTPLQNDVMELWSLMHFLMPQIFSSQQDFKEWFSNPFSQSINQNQSLNLGVVQKLQSILRPFLLRRMKRDVEKQLPEKIEHIVQCTLSRRQRLLYDEYINNDKTQSTLTNSDFFSIMNVLMQLRKVCNHPDLFEARTIDSPFIMCEQLEFQCPQLVYCSQISRNDPLTISAKEICNFPALETTMTRIQADSIRELFPSRSLQDAHKDGKYLNARNTQNLYLTVPQILPHNPPVAQHQHPAFVSPAALPFVSEFFKSSSQSSSSTTDQSQYQSCFTDKSEKVKHAKRLIALMHADLQNRRKILFQTEPVYGIDLRQAVLVPMPLNIDATNKQPYINYVNRFTKTIVSKSSYVPASSIFNQFVQQEKKEVKIYEINNSDYQNKNTLIQEVNYLKNQNQAKNFQQLETKSKFREIVQEQIIQQPPGIHGVIIEIDVGKAKQAQMDDSIETADILNMYSLKQVWVTTQEPITPSVQSEQDSDMQEDQIDNKVPLDANMHHSEHYSDEEDENQDEADEKRRAEQAQQFDQQTKQVNDYQEYDYQILPKFTDALRDLITSPQTRISCLEDSIKYFKCIIPKVVCRSPQIIPTKIDTLTKKTIAYERYAYQKLMSHKTVTQSLKWSNILFFPHKNLVQYDCGKLQRLAQLLKTLYLKGSKVLIFTQMTRMLDILEQFLNLHGYTYVRLDGSVKVEARQKMVDRFNLSPKLFCFISSTRCGGIGINLTGADCVIFFDTDWNPAMDKQAQDRSHRIGQTKTVHIYRLISVNTVEENIFKKSLQKRELGGLIIAGEAFDSEYFQRLNMKDILNNQELIPKLKKKDIMQEENIIFHHQNAYSLTDTNEDDQQRQRDLEAYRQKFEEAMIRIEDEEDIEAYREAKAELDDEFKEVEGEGDEKEQKSTNAAGQMEMDEQQKEVVEDNQEMIEIVEDQKTSQKSKQLDSKNASGVSKDLRRNELIEWNNHPSLNAATKMAIQMYEKQFNFEDYMKEREEKEGKKSMEGLDSQDEKSDIEEEEDAGVNGWDRQWAERMFIETKDELAKCMALGLEVDTLD